MTDEKVVVPYHYNSIINVKSDVIICDFHSAGKRYPYPLPCTLSSCISEANERRSESAAKRVSGRRSE